MNTLEDAFINIGLEEQKLLAHNSADKNMHNHNNHNFQFPVPASINKSIKFKFYISINMDFLDPEYKFFDQFLAIFKRKLFFTIRSPAMIVLTLLPLFFIFLGVSGSTYVYNENLKKASTDNKVAVDVIAHLIFLFYFINRFLWLV